MREWQENTRRSDSKSQAPAIDWSVYGGVQGLGFSTPAVISPIYHLLYSNFFPGQNMTEIVEASLMMIGLVEWLVFYYIVFIEE